MKFSSAVDLLYTIALIVIGVIGILFSDLMFILGYWYISLIVVAIFSLLFWMFLDTSIILYDDKLQIKLAFFKKNIRYADIKEIKKTKNCISSFATSRSRIGIRTGEKTGVFRYKYISPKDEEKFINELKTKVGENVLYTNLD